MAKKNNSTANLLGKVLSQKATTPIQENKKNYPPNPPTNKNH